MIHSWGLFFFMLLLIQKQGIFFLVKADHGNNGFITTQGVHLMLNGSPFYSNGFNAYWLMYFAADPSQRDKITSVFEEARQHGLTLARTWAFNDGQDRALQNSPGSYNEQTFQV
uniref:Mannan endo-1,4-beta-mannosidase n=1 Tax=Rhizophora mucronata TaxID=61149 RepID=A0A2P2JED0_RHIMU